MDPESTVLPIKLSPKLSTLYRDPCTSAIPFWRKTTEDNFSQIVKRWLGTFVGSGYNATMRQDNFSQFEDRIQYLIEGGFARLFAGRLHLEYENGKPIHGGRRNMPFEQRRAP